MPTVALTSAAVLSACNNPPATSRIEIWDAKTPGLALRVSATGAASWSFRYRPREGHGYQRLTLGSVDDVPLAVARQRVARLRADVVEGADPQRERVETRVAAANALTFDRLAERYLEEYAKPRKASWRNDELYLKRPRAKWGDRDAKSITRRDAIAVLDEIKATAPISANRTHSILVCLFNWAVEDELLDVNPIAGLKKRAREKAKERALEDDELAVLWRSLVEPEAISIEIAEALRAILLTGQRPGEIAGMTRSEALAVDKLAEARWELPSHRMKARRAHVVPLAPLALELVLAALKRRRAHDGDEAEGTSLFASRFHSREALARHSLSQGLRRVINGLRITEDMDPRGREARAIASLKEQPPTPHDLRRSVATGLSRLGIPREDRLAVLAHAPDDVHGKHYDRYARLREKRVALEAWERHVAQVIGRAEVKQAEIVPITASRVGRRQRQRTG